MPMIQRTYAVQHGSVIPESELTPAARAILERIGRCAYMIRAHRKGIAINSRRIAELQAELQRIEGGQ